VISATLGSMTMSVRNRPPVFCGIVPPHILEHLAHDPEQSVREAALRSLELDALHRRQRALAGPAAAERAAAPAAPPSLPLRTVYDARHTRTLPGTAVRAEGADPVPDQAVDRAYDGLGDTFALYLDIYGRHSVDGRGLPLDATVHYGTRYDNAFWNGSQMVFGDGDGGVFNDFTTSVDVIGHELTHGVVQFSADLDYRGQSGALNESLADVFGSLVKQYALGQTADEADWLIGAGLLAPGVQGVALRSLKAPGTAYDDPRLGRDPQPATMDGYQVTDGDDGGVHINSGIPNRAFHLTATGIGGHAWERAGQIWYDVLTGGGLAADADFAAFAAATLAAAKARYGAGPEHEATASAWNAVGVGVRTEVGSGVRT
jgi:Zn-dependent metalloprotease